MKFTSVSNTFLKGNISSSHLLSHLSACSLLLLVHFFKSSLFPDLFNKHLLRSEKSRNEKTGLALSDSLSSIFLLFCFLSPSLRCWLPLRRCPGSPPVQMACRLTFLIISGHCYRHLCSSHWPPAGDAGLFCCSTCEHPAARALRNTGTLRNLPAPKPTPAGRGGQTSPGTATTLLLTVQRDGKGGGRHN